MDQPVIIAPWTGEALLTSSVWEPVLANLRTICFSNRNTELSSLPNILKRAKDATFVSILAARLGTAKEPLLLQGGITTVSKLSIRAKQIHVRIPSSGVTWNSVYFHDCEELDIWCAKPWHMLPNILHATGAENRFLPAGWTPVLHGGSSSVLWTPSSSSTRCCEGHAAWT